MFSLTEKQALRRDLRRARAEAVGTLSPDQQREVETALAARIETLVALGGAVASYAPMGHEVDPSPVEALADGPVLLPYFAGRDAGMTFRRSGGELEAGPWGVMQPSADAAPMRPDILLVPLVGATKAGDRLGQGQGHFDRTIAELRASGPLLTIGLAWDCQIVETLPTDPWDEVLDMIATPSALYRAR